MQNVFGKSALNIACTFKSNRIELRDTRYRSPNYRTKMPIFDSRDGLLRESINHVGLCTPK